MAVEMVFFVVFPWVLVGSSVYLYKLSGGLRKDGIDCLVSN